MVEYDPFAAEIREDPLPVYAELRRDAPAYYLPKYDAWALSRFEDIWAYSSDPRFSAAQGTAPAQVLVKEQPLTPMLNVMDPPEHTRLRGAIRKSFLPANVRALEPMVREIFEQRLDAALEQGGCDVVLDLAAPLSVQVACHAIGLPPEDGPMLTELVGRFFSHDPDEQGMAASGLAALSELTDYCTQRARQRRRETPDGPQALDSLIRFDMDGRQFDDQEIGSHLTMLVIGGSETFPKTLANGIVRLWEHPDQRASLATDPSGIPDAYDEILRYDMPTQFLCRTLIDDVEIHDRELRAGQGVMFLYASANRDEREFEQPDVFDIGRRASRFLSFGAGTHACLGTHVARMEGRITLGSILSRCPEYDVDFDGAERLRTEFVQGYARLPILF